MLAAFILMLAPLSAAEPRTLRLDYFHAGGASEERFSRDAVVGEGPWAGNPGRPLDELNLGKYLFEVTDRITNRVVYSRGFASLFGEWEATTEAKESPRTFHESLRFPEPAGPVQVAVKKRGKDGAFREVWSVSVDPKDPTIDQSSPSPAVTVWAVEKNGEPRDKVDLLLLGDGYTAAEMDKWHRDAKRMAETLFAVSPFKERRKDFNVWAADTPSDESGVGRVSDGVHRRSALRAGYDAFGSERYVLTFDNKRMREAAAAAPYEFVEIVVNDHKYGGGGIFGLYATVAADSVWAPYHFAGLADEYYTSEVAYAAATERPEPWEPNVTADPRAAKWRDLVTTGTPLPTSWEKAAFETLQKEIQGRRREIRARQRPEEEMDALFREERARESVLLAKSPHANAVGAFEGAVYEAKGYYRPQADCIMFSRAEAFCAVCRRAIERVIDLYSQPGR
jgi:hypothetical protein